MQSGPSTCAAAEDNRIATADAVIVSCHSHLGSCQTDQARPGQSFHAVKDRSETSATNLAGTLQRKLPLEKLQSAATLRLGPRPPGQPATKSFAAAPSKLPQRERIWGLFGTVLES